MAPVLGLVPALARCRCCRGGCICGIGDSRGLIEKGEDRKRPEREGFFCLRLNEMLHIH